MEKKKRPGRPANPDAIRNLPRVILSVPHAEIAAIDFLCLRQNCSRSELFQFALAAYIKQLPRKSRAPAAGLLRGRKLKDPGLTCVDAPVNAKPAVEAFVRLWVNPKDSYERAARRFFQDFMDLPED
jgi:hypothetical protein